MNPFDAFLVQPLFNALIFIYNIIPDIGVATIILTIIIRAILYPLFQKSTKQQILMSKIQPELAKLQKEYKDNKEKLVKAQMELYKKYGASPFGSCLITLLQLPILLAVYRVFLNGFSDERMAALYNFIIQPDVVNIYFLGIIDLSQPNIWLAIITAIIQFISSKMLIPPSPNKSSKDEPQVPMQRITASLQKNMGLIAPLITFVILVRLPSILAVYWSVSTLFSIFQQWLVQKNINIDEDKKEV